MLKISMGSVKNAASDIYGVHDADDDGIQGGTFVVGCQPGTAALHNQDNFALASA
jgi:hypothetical protein